MTVRRAPVLVVLRALGLGDFLSAVPAYRALARAFPHHRRILAAPRSVHPLLELLGETFAEAVDVAPLGPLPEVASDIDVGVNLHGRGPQSHGVLRSAGARRLIAFAHPAVAQVGAPIWLAGEHEVARWRRLLQSAGIAADADELDLAVPAEPVPERFCGATVVHPGAASVARRWPAERYAAIVRQCLLRGERVVLTGSRSERSLTAGIAARAGLPPSHDVAGRTSLLELAALVAAAGRVLCGDTGVAHLATAYRTPSLVLFGPVPPSEWGPPARPQHRALWAGRRGDPHGAVPDPGLLRITPAHVLAGLDALPPVESKGPLAR